MSHQPKLSAAAANASADALTALLNGGTVNLYTAPQPATADTAITTQTLLATCTFANPAFAAAVAGVATAHALTDDTDAANSGTAVFFRALTSGGATVFDGTCGTENADCVLSNVEIVAHGTVTITSCTIRVALS